MIPAHRLYPLAGLAADGATLLWRPGRRRIRENLRAALGTDDAATLDYWAQRQLRRYAGYLLDTLRLPALTPDDCVDALHVDPDVWPRLRALAAQGPCIFLSLHIGNWDLAAAAWARQVGPLTVLVQSLGHSALDGALRHQRRRLGLHPLPIESGLRPALRTLRRGGALGLLLDRPLPPDHAGVTVTFCGRPCRLPAGPARLALATGARVVPLAVIRTHPHALRFRVQIDPGFTYHPSGDRDRDVQALTQALMTWFEDPVRRYPDQWYMFRRFFPAAAPGVPAPARRDRPPRGAPPRPTAPPARSPSPATPAPSRTARRRRPSAPT